jgi:hypothetical protein
MPGGVLPFALESFSEGLPTQPWDMTRKWSSIRHSWSYTIKDNAAKGQVALTSSVSSSVGPGLVFS